MGYPERLAGDDIPLLATIVGFADAWDAMTIERPYQPGLRTEEAFDEVREHRGTQFSPRVVDAFFAVVAKRPGDFGVEFRSARRPLAAHGGRTRTVPAVMSAPANPFRSSIRQIALRGSPA